MSLTCNNSSIRTIALFICILLIMSQDCKIVVFLEINKILYFRRIVNKKMRILWNTPFLLFYYFKNTLYLYL